MSSRRATTFKAWDPKRPVRKPEPETPSAETIFKARADLSIHQNNIQWSRLFPLQWVFLGFLAGNHVIRDQPLLPRVYLLGVCLALILYVLANFLVDRRKRLANIQQLEAMGFSPRAKREVSAHMPSLKRMALALWHTFMRHFDLISTLGVFTLITTTMVVAFVWAPTFRSPQQQVQPEQAEPADVGR